MLVQRISGILSACNMQISNTKLCESSKCWVYSVMYDSYLLKDVHSVLVNFPREYAQESMMLYI